MATRSYTSHLPVHFCPYAPSKSLWQAVWMHLYVASTLPTNHSRRKGLGKIYFVSLAAHSGRSTRSPRP